MLDELADYPVETEDDSPDVASGPWIGLVWSMLMLVPCVAALAALAELSRWMKGLMTR